MGGATPHGGVEPSVGPKTVVVGFPRVVVVCLLALAELARRKAAAVEGMNLDQVGKAEASKPPRALHADGPADASLESLHSLCIDIMGWRYLLDVTLTFNNYRVISM